MTERDVLEATRTLGYDAELLRDPVTNSITVTANGKSVRFSSISSWTPRALVSALDAGLGEEVSPAEGSGVGLQNFYDVIDKWSVGLSDAAKSALSEHDVEALKMASWRLFQGN